MRGEERATALFTIEDVIAAMGGTVRQRGGGEITGVSTDTRTIGPGDLFVALRGPNFDGAAFVIDALRAGSSGAVVPTGFFASDAAAGIKGADITIFETGDTLKALQDMARFHRLRLNPFVAAVTGSNGKTTTKEMLAAILAVREPVLKTEGNLNNEIGLPLTLLKLKPHQKRAVLEMGMSAPGEIRLLAHLARPDVAVITNVAAAHLQGLGSVENVARAKAEILEGLSGDGVAVLNGDDEHLMKAASGFGGRVITFGIGEANDVRASDIILDHRARPTFILHSGGEATAIHLAITGRHNVYNALAASATAVAAGFKHAEIRAGLEATEGTAMRMEIRSVAGRRLIVDCYNANPGSMKAALETLETLRGRRWAVLGDMLELGEATPVEHREVGRLAASVGLRGLILMGEYAGFVAEGAKAGGMNERFIFVCRSHEEAADLLLQHSAEGETALIKGSRGSRMEKVVAAMDLRQQGV